MNEELDKTLDQWALDLDLDLLRRTTMPVKGSGMLQRKELIKDYLMKVYVYGKENSWWLDQEEDKR